MAYDTINSANEHFSELLYLLRIINKESSQDIQQRHSSTVRFTVLFVVGPIFYGVKLFETGHPTIRVHRITFKLLEIFSRHLKEDGPQHCYK